MMLSHRLLLLVLAIFAIASCKQEHGRHLKSTTATLMPAQASYAQVSGLDSVTYKTEYFYNEKHQLIQKRMSASSVLVDAEVINYDYDDEGRMINENLEKDKKVVFITSYEYDAGGRCVRINRTVPNGSTANYDSVTYEGNMITVESYHNRESTGKRTEFEIDPQTLNVIKSVRYTPSKPGGDVTLYQYDDKINPFKKLGFPSNQILPWNYSANNIVQRIDWSNDSLNEPADTNYITYTYDAQNYPLTGKRTVYAYEEF